MWFQSPILEKELKKPQRYQFITPPPRQTEQKIGRQKLVTGVDEFDRNMVHRTVYDIYISQK